MRKPKPSDILLADLYDHRERGKCYTQEEIAEYTGIKRQVVSRVEINALHKSCEKLVGMLESQGLHIHGTNRTTNLH
jgi:predicted XRE-type DNA-binding protein